MTDLLIPATVIGSWSFPGWFEKFVADVKAHPERFGPGRSRGGRPRRGAAGRRRPASCRARPDHRRRDAARRFQPGLLRIPAGPGADRQRPGDWARRRTISATATGAIAPLSAPDGLGTVAEYRRLREYHRPRRSRCRFPARSRWPAASTAAPSTTAATRSPRPSSRSSTPSSGRSSPPGVDFIQLDEPSFACHPGEPESFLDVIARTVEGVHAYISMHMCFGNYRARAVGHRSYRPLFPHIGRAPGQPARPGIRQPRDGRGRAARASCPRRWTSPWGWSTSRTPGSSRRSWSPSGCGPCSRYVDAGAGLGHARLRLLADRPARGGGQGQGDGRGGRRWSANELETMIEPVRQGRELIDEIAGTVPPAGSLVVWWLGQSGFLIKSRRGLARRSTSISRST